MYEFLRHIPSNFSVSLNGQAQDVEESIKELKDRWQYLREGPLKDTARFPEATFNFDTFLRILTIALAHSAYIEALQCHVFVPGLGCLRRTGNGLGADVVFNAESNSI